MQHGERYKTTWRLFESGERGKAPHVARRGGSDRNLQRLLESVGGGQNQKPFTGGLKKIVRALRPRLHFGDGIRRLSFARGSSGFDTASALSCPARQHDRCGRGRARRLHGLFEIKETEEKMIWSFSEGRLFRKCQRQWYFGKRL